MGDRGPWGWCKVQQKVVPVDEIIRERPSDKPAVVSHGYIPDEMPPTKHPCDKRHYTSKSKFREVTKAHGREEVGTAYEHGYDPSKENERVSKERTKKIMQEIVERRNG